MTLRFTLDNTTGATDVNNVVFTDTVSDVLPGLSALQPLPVAPCGGTLFHTFLFLSAAA